MHDFEYHRAASLGDAQEKISAADDGRFLAGGMTLLPVLKQRLDKPSDLVDLGDLDDLRGISEEGGAIVIKAMTVHNAVATSDLVKDKIPALAQLAGSIGDPMVRNRGTIGGSLANSDPAADYPAAVLGLGATIHTDKREIAGDDYFVAMFETALEEGEIITHVSFPIPEQADYSRFPNPASRFPIVAVFAAKTADGTRIGVTGAGPSAFRVSEMEEALAGS
ncbi:MAG: FAD binding domain-containing protein, partial [Rhodospirillales bacterium]|nr:FAD binding domain-containing protein [Rhodospirillales bacterium]